MSDNSLFNLMQSIVQSNQSMINYNEPKIANPDDVLIKNFHKEQKAKRIYQPILIIGLLSFIFVQLVFTNDFYNETVDELIQITKNNNALPQLTFKLYSQILKQLEFYTTAVLCEFISIFYIIIRWGFSTKITDLFSNFFKKTKSKKKK